MNNCNMQTTLNSDKQVILESKSGAIAKQGNAYGYIYRTVNEINGKIYIGQHKGEFNKRYTGSGDQIIPAVKKYGRKNFSVKAIAWSESLKELNEFEVVFLAKYREIFGEDNIYNIADGGLGSPGTVRSEESRKKIRLILTGRVGRKLSTKERKRLRSFRLGKPHREDTKAKMSAWQKGRPWSEELHIKHMYSRLRRIWAKIILEADASKSPVEGK